MHNAIARYFGNELGPAPLNDLRPSKIMELGCGTGAWSDTEMAIQAAKQFPDAQVVAVDKFPLPDRILPPNLNFQLADLKQELEFEDETFDVVDALKPGGLLLIEDLDAISLAESGGPATRRSQYKFKEIQDRRGVDVEFGRKIEAIITSFGDFSDIQVKKVSMPFGANTPDKTLNQLGSRMKKFITEFFGTLLHSLQDQGLTNEIVCEFREEQELPDNESVMDMILVRPDRGLGYIYLGS
ncbi:hypothetical protein C8R45DRAFT_1068127 [Mycena sanguinolenta]|nr:hypothetical protein C8R45DRAFT_1068127 [Mycena sanguinolenta]